MTNEVDLAVSLDVEEQEIVRVLQEEMGLISVEDVFHMLLRQARLRLAVVCPTCGHVGQTTAEDVARCHSCLSILQLSNEIWTAVTMHDHGMPSGD